MIYISVGTISEIIKFSPVIRIFRKKKIPFKVIHNGQNPDSMVLFKKLKLGKPDIIFRKSSREKWVKKGKIYSMILGGLWTLRLFSKMFSLFKKEKPDIVFYQGDCVSVPFTALAAKLAGCKTAHRESGLRSGNLFEPFPEEIDRIIGDKLGNFLFVPTKEALSNISHYSKKKKVVFIGEGQAENLEYALKQKPSIKIPKNYLLVNIHRFENISSEEKMKSLVKTLNESPFKVIFPINMNTRKKLEKFGLFDKLSKKIKIIEPQDYINFAHLMKNAEAIITDSGGVQVEACVLRIPCVVFRKESEWKETIKRGFTKLSTDSDKIKGLLEEVKLKKGFYKAVKKNKRPEDYTGKPSKKIAEVLG